MYTCTCTAEYRQSAPHRLSPPPLFFHIERIGIVIAPPLVYPPPPPFPSILFLVISHLTSVLLPVISLPPCIMKFQNVQDLSGNVADYSLGLHVRRSRHDRRSRPVCVAVVVRQWRGSKHFCKHDVPSQITTLLVDCSCSPWLPYARAHRRSRHLRNNACAIKDEEC